VKAAQQLNGVADILLSDSVADGADLGIGKGSVASQDHEVEEHLAVMRPGELEKLVTEGMFGEIARACLVNKECVD
jgi:hypothetical protein